MTPRDFLNLGFRLAGASDEASWRTAVSRGYYAAFHVARELLAGMGFQVPYADKAHAYLGFRLQNSGEARVERAGRSLSALRRVRNQADYDIGPLLAQAVARNSVQQAEAIVLILESASLDPVRSQILAAMRTYEATVLRQVTWRP